MCKYSGVARGSPDARAGNSSIQKQQKELHRNLQNISKSRTRGHSGVTRQRWRAGNGLWLAREDLTSEEPHD